MNFDNTQQSTDPRIASQSRAYVVYDRTTGEILHIHHSVSFPDGAPIHEAPETRARRLAGNKAGANVDVLEVESDEVNHGKPIRINTINRVVVTEAKIA